MQSSTMRAIRTDVHATHARSPPPLHLTSPSACHALHHLGVGRADDALQPAEELVEAGVVHLGERVREERQVLHVIVALIRHLSEEDSRVQDHQGIKGLFV